MFSSPRIFRIVKLGMMRRVGESRKVNRIFVETPLSKYILEKSRRRWENNIKIDLRDMKCEDGNFVELAQFRV
jgi:hypothetical protein